MSVPDGPASFSSYNKVVVDRPDIQSELSVSLFKLVECSSTGLNDFLLGLI